MLRESHRPGIEPRPVNRKSNALPLSHHATRNSGSPRESRLLRIITDHGSDDSCPSTTVGIMYVSVGVRTLTFELLNHWPGYLACWFILTLSRLSSNVKVMSQSSRWQKLSNCWDDWPWLKSRPELETVNKWFSESKTPPLLPWSTKMSLKWPVQPRIRAF